jgi:mannose-1-phosphate guanylyltransferase/phosphomannomutase
MKAVIMAGGFGTRLRPLSLNIPKPMVFMAGKPMMEHIIVLLERYGFTELVALLYFQADDIKNYFGTGAKLGVNIEYVMAAADYGTAGSVKNAEEFLDERFLVISGDVLTDFDLGACLEFHKEKKAGATMVLTRVENPLQYGLVITDKDGRITRFLEKPTWGQVFSDTVNTGIYILEPDILESIPPRTEFDFSKDLFPGMLEKGEALYGYDAPGYWRDIGNLDEYARAHQDILDGKVRVSFEGNVLERGDAGHQMRTQIWADRNVHLGEDIEFGGTVILGEGTDISDNCKLFNSVVGREVRIGKSASLTRSVVWDHTDIGPGAALNESIVCNNAIIGARAHLNENSIVSENCVIGEEAVIKANVKVWPDKKVEAGATLSSSLVWGETWNRALFCDSKVSGIGNTELTPEFAAKLGAAYGAFLGKYSSLLCCRDAGLSSRMINRAINCGLLSAGVNISDLQMLPIPVLRFTYADRPSTKK